MNKTLQHYDEWLWRLRRASAMREPARSDQLRQIARRMSDDETALLVRTIRLLGQL